ncbi:LIM and senescent cell antigen-like-containing domain protein 1 [Rhopilema esculentum]|uniref:LIM and senescent cell antigen-like-containing domain protein 1 n=1 Tax=Rhopilema esculentum TaxID=499914 RepID=UPI0031E19F6F
MMPGFRGGEALCFVCHDGFTEEERMVNTSGQIYHEKCFVCAQCFRPFENGLFYEYDGRQYCEYDFQQLYAPCCNSCGEYVIGRVIKAMHANWHPDCFRCELCKDPLADTGFIKNAGRALCKRCHAAEKAKGGRYLCNRCHTYIEEGGHIMYMGEPVHPWHYNCYACNKELDVNCRKKNNELYCLRCHDKMGTPICGSCRRPVEDRVVNALGKQWHVEHFCCAQCEKPFYGHRHYEKNGLAYCETHFNELFGDICFVCNRAIARDVVTALNKCYCVQHFACWGCNVKLTLKSKFHEFDMKPLCLKCHEKLPRELRKRLRKAESANR